MPRISRIPEVMEKVNERGSSLQAKPPLQLLRRDDETTPIIKSITETTQFEERVRLDRDISIIACAILLVSGVALAIAGLLPHTGLPSALGSLGLGTAVFGLAIGIKYLYQNKKFHKNMDKIGEASKQDAFGVITFANGKEKKVKSQRSERIEHVSRKRRKEKEERRVKVREEVPSSSAPELESESGSTDSSDTE